MEGGKGCFIENLRNLHDFIICKAKISDNIEVAENITQGDVIYEKQCTGR